MSNKGNVVCLALLLLVINVYSFGFPLKVQRNITKTNMILQIIYPMSMEEVWYT